MLPGTRQLQRPLQGAVTKGIVGDFHSYTFGRPKNGNRHTGIWLGINRHTFPERYHHAIEVPEARDKFLQGRLAMVRIRAPTCDLTFFPAYFPPSGSYQADRIYSAMVKWIDARINKLPHRTTPIITGDLNRRLGFHRENGEMLPIDTTFVINPTGAENSTATDMFYIALKS